MFSLINAAISATTAEEYDLFHLLLSVIWTERAHLEVWWRRYPFLSRNYIVRKAHLTDCTFRLTRPWFSSLQTVLLCSCQFTVEWVCHVCAYSEVGLCLRLILFCRLQWDSLADSSRSCRMSLVHLRIVLISSLLTLSNLSFWARLSVRIPSAHSVTGRTPPPPQYKRTNSGWSRFAVVFIFYCSGSFLGSSCDVVCVIFEKGELRESR